MLKAGKKKKPGEDECLNFSVFWSHIKKFWKSLMLLHKLMLFSVSFNNQNYTVLLLGYYIKKLPVA